MAQTRQGTRESLPFDPVDPRDMKYFANQGSYWWSDSDDPFRWRDSLPFVRAGLAELVMIGSLFLVIAAALAYLWVPLAVPPLVIFGLVVWFFRDPARPAPEEMGTVVSPADGKIVQIEDVNDPTIGPAIQVGIFLSIFNVHVNRASLPGQVVAVKYRPGKFLNALRPESARENENLDVVLKLEHEETFENHGDSPPARLLRIRQITGQFARRIVCWVRTGDVLRRGEAFGMIKLGSRTELVIPKTDGLEVCVSIGEKVKAGTTVMAKYRWQAKEQSNAPESEAGSAPVIAAGQ